MFKVLFVVSVACLVVASPGELEAGYIVYTIDETGSVTIGSQSYQNVSVAITITADTANVQTLGPPNENWLEASQFASVEYSSAGNFDVFASSPSNHQLSNAYYYGNSTGQLTYNTTFGAQVVTYQSSTSLGTYNMTTALAPNAIQTPVFQGNFSDYVGASPQYFSFFASTGPFGTTGTGTFSAGVTPEPSSLALMAIAGTTALGLAALRRAKRMAARA